MRCIAIDPGSSTGWALYESRRLVACGACKPEAVWHAVGLVGRVYLEKPQKYPHDDIDPNTLITLAISAGIAVGPFVAYGARLDTIKPRDWKGQLPKKVSHARSFAALTDPERGIVAASGRGMSSKPLLDMLDAVALGQHAIATGAW